MLCVFVYYIMYVCAVGDCVFDPRFRYGGGGSITQKDKCPFRRKGHPNKYNSTILYMIYLWQACRTLYTLYVICIYT